MMTKSKKKKLDKILYQVLTGNRPKGGGQKSGAYISIGGTQINSDGYIEFKKLVYIKKEYFKKVSRTQVKRHDILMTKDGANSGDVAIAWKKLPNVVTNEHVFTLRVKKEFCAPYIYYYLLSHEGWKQLKGVITGSAQEGINKSFTRKVSIYLPALPEQQKIASILCNIDKALQKTEQIINQTQRVKKGLMQDLFTEGYDEHQITKGNQRWKEVPKDWDLLPLNEVATVNPRYNKPDRELSYIEMDAVNKDLPYPDYIGQRNPKNNSGSLFAKEDTLFARITPCTENGKICFVDSIDTNLGIASTELIVLSPNKEKILPKYLYHFARTHKVCNYAISRMRGTTGRQRVPFSVFKKELFIPLPKKTEQEKIVNVLDSLDQKKINFGEIKEQLQRIKRGLMKDLLTGKVRTHDKDIEILDEVKDSE
jgi:type I restriction enzyme S subunit